MTRRFISQGIRFHWKVDVHPIKIDELPKCEHCGGSGKTCGILSYPDDDLTCGYCYGRGRKSWMEPRFDEGLREFLQKKLDDYLMTEGYPGLDKPYIEYVI